MERSVGGPTRVEPKPAVRFVDERLDVRVDRVEPVERGSDGGVDVRPALSARVGAARA
jgi:hypothetical protein